MVNADIDTIAALNEKFSQIKIGITTEKEMIDLLGEPTEVKDVKEPKLKNYPERHLVVGKDGSGFYVEQRHLELNESQEGMECPWKHIYYRFVISYKSRLIEEWHICLIVNKGTGIIEDHFTTVTTKKENK